MNKKNILISLLGLSILFACTKDVVEKDLNGKNIVLVSPADNDTLSSLTNVFWWNEMEGATKYHLQIVTPQFSSVQQLLLDSNIAGDHFSFTLPPGRYQWRVRGFNGSSETEYSVRTLTIDSTSSLAGQTLVLVSPANGFLTNSVSAMTFKWNGLYAAEDYRLQIINDSTSANVLDVIVPVDSFSYTLGGGKYTWQVRAQNATSNTLYTSRTFTIDVTAPPVSAMTYPLNGDTISKPDTLLWTHGAGVTGDSLFIYQDSLLSPAAVKIYTTSTSYPFTGTTMQKYFWRLKSRDSAGNWSGYGVLNKFTVY